jgi:translation initiation factor 2 subunit 3
MDFQPVMNIGMIGHVSDGKTTITKQLTGTLTQKHSSEKQKNLTIRLGYANAKILKCSSCKEPECYFSVSSETFDYICPTCNSTAILMNHVSFVDCPGHNMLLATMLNGTSVMDYTILVESVSNPNIPAPQTLEHFNCIKNMNIKNIATILNKIDLITKEKTKDLCIDLQTFLKENNCESKVIPMSATHKINLDILCMILANLPKPQRSSDNFKMPIIRSFNINKPGTDIDNLNGGVIGGSIISGEIKLDDELYLIPGMIIKEECKYKPLKCKVLTINSEKNNLSKAFPGGLIGIKLDIDPGLTADDGLSGNILTNNITGIVTNNFNVILNKKLDNTLDLLGSTPRIERNTPTGLLGSTPRIERNTNYIFNINSNNINGKLKKIEENLYEVKLDNYQYIDNNDIITISINNNSSITLLDFCKFDINQKYQSISQI